jgi:3-phenylpropionate/trans-cinnamate dioxygenase ferredoxin reductase subunit
MLEALPQPMVRGLGPELGAAIAAVHRDHGVDLRTNVIVDEILGDGEQQVRGVRLGDGSLVDADVVVVGVGVGPETRWLERSGLALDNGVVCDERCEAAPGIVAAGDVARFRNPLFDGLSMRLEHWTNATEQGVHAARRLLGHDDAFAPVPFVWSDQYDRKIQTVGIVSADADVHVAHGTVADQQFVALFGQDGRLTGALGFNRARFVMQYRKLIAERASWDDALKLANQ